MTHATRRIVLTTAVCAALWAPASAQQVSRVADPAGVSASHAATTPAVPADYVIGREDVLTIVFWREKDLSSDVVVRPDGKISLPLLKDVQAAGLTPDQLTESLVQTASKYIGQPNATVMVKEINSRKVFVLGQVAKPGTFNLAGNVTVLQALAVAGDVLEYAKHDRIVVVRQEDGAEHRFKFNYKEVVNGKRTEQNILLKPGDTIIVP